MRRLC
jgi:Rrf2 family protein